MSPKAFRDPSTLDGERRPRRKGRAGRSQIPNRDRSTDRDSGPPFAVSAQRRETRWQGRPITAGQVALGLLLAAGVATLTAHWAGRWFVVAPSQGLNPPVAAMVANRPTRQRSASTTLRPPPAPSLPTGGAANSVADASAPGAASPGQAPGAGQHSPATSAGHGLRPMDAALADIRFVAEAHGPQVRACYDRVFRHDAAAPSGRIELSFTVVPAGEFGRATEIRSELNLLGSPLVESCLIELLAEWSLPRPLPPPLGAAPPRLRYPFIFTAAP